MAGGPTASVAPAAPGFFPSNSVAPAGAAPTAATPFPVAGAATPSELTRRSRSSFYYAFLFLDPARRAALDAVYAFCRLVDDAADEPQTAGEAQARLGHWRARVEDIFRDESAASTSTRTGAAATDEDRICEALRAASRRFPLHREDLDAVIEGCEWDVTRHRYQTWDELRAYCLRVASAVGLLCIEIFGYQDPRARAYAVDLGLALQLTNILRDVDEDAARGRIYLPLEDLRAFGVDEQDLLSPSTAPGRPENVRRLLRFQAQRARLHFLRARAHIDRGERDHLVVAEIMGDIYYALLERLERDGFPHRRSSLSAPRKAALALRRFLSARLHETLS